MAAVNKVILVGNLGRDPEVRYSNEQMAIANVSVATTSTWKDKSSGERREDTEWHRVVFYGRQAEVVGQYLKKGSSVYIEGRLKTRKWVDKDGVERYTTEIIAEQMQMLGGNQDQGAQSQATQQAQRPSQAQANDGFSSPPRQAQPVAQQRQVQSPALQGLEHMGEDIPF